MRFAPVSVCERGIDESIWRLIDCPHVIPRKSPELMVLKVRRDLYRGASDPSEYIAGGVEECRHVCQ